MPDPGRTRRAGRSQPQDRQHRGERRLHPLDPARTQAGAGAGPASRRPLLPRTRFNRRMKMTASDIEKAERVSRARSLIMALMAAVLLIQGVLGFGDEA